MLKRHRMSGQRWARVMRDGHTGDPPAAGGGGGSGQGAGQQPPAAPAPAGGTPGQSTGQEGAQQQGSAGTGTGTDKGFPDNTPLTEMTVEQQAAYWKHHARKHEARANQAPTQQEIDEYKRKAAEFDRLEQANKSELEKANDTVAAQEKTLAEYRAKEVRLAALTAAGLPLSDLEFITATDEATATQQATRLKERLGTTSNGSNGTNGTVPQGYQGKGSGKGSGVAAGRELYKPRNQKTN